jgi:hypothetical protein
MSSVQQHLHDSAPGLVGTSIAGGFTVVGFVTNSIPVLQAISLLFGIAVAAVTFIYYWRKVKKGE